ncbi:PREDICTED: signal peptidase complex catalytic subunit SEC11C isoform X4 [Mandrillus leucophaeus]|uniref:signal peptidase complex catalytic subunit SEC11C isoform X4 n=1 Tax=Colobus angolensis palliatus TaxID=336983 RepID=UPI0003ABCDE5|nr:PREDICTED: signal peptidase complex catalytic subunit SEC11C isoform X4 [Colobus angolensis palliatus]XP_011827088.1 PREDICTED: signal peptidase complex catalytic subunit SEC11C isoform X4 [Mandrillus leucophaeus]XP_025221381.1 signal peptidase complex catalytic subunit SEC11C isoform X4 [Theropithecus gelada]XP_037843890.1 signal peptidase complex catalytic subunit SEC11C isoform X3 [Chlorocebus sabaeus]
MVRAGAVGAHLPASGLDIFGDLRKMNKRQLYYQVLNFAMIVSSALMIWKGLIVLTGSESPIVVVLRDNGDIKFLTKGDNNEVDDRGLYKEGQNWLEKKDVVGRARGFLPYVGMVTIIMNDYPKFKYALLAIMGAYVLLKRES